MRDIRFRAWDTLEKCFNFDISIDLGGDIYEYGTHHFYKFPKRIVLMQYTGLKDKNGKEIYEGDIVYKCKGDPIRENKGIVLYRDDLQSFVLHHPNAMPVSKYPKEWLPLFGANSIMETISKYEIIGNLHENPELLKEQA